MNTVISSHNTRICNDLQEIIRVKIKLLKDKIPIGYHHKIQQICDNQCLNIQQLLCEPKEIVKVKNEKIKQQKDKHEKNNLKQDSSKFSLKPINKYDNILKNITNTEKPTKKHDNILKNITNKKPINKEYTKEELKENQEIYLLWYGYRKKNKEEVNKQTRLPIMPEDISETKIQHILQDNGDKTVTRDCKGDLHSKDGQIECKCITSNGAISFSPSSTFDKLYIMDARDFEITNRITLYKINHNRTSKIWGDIIVNKKLNQSFNYQASYGRRPRITFEKLKSYIETEIVFEGNFIDD